MTTLTPLSQHFLYGALALRPGRGPSIVYMYNNNTYTAGTWYRVPVPELASCTRYCTVLYVRARLWYRCGASLLTLCMHCQYSPRTRERDFGPLFVVGCRHHKYFYTTMIQLVFCVAQPLFLLLGCSTNIHIMHIYLS